MRGCSICNNDYGGQCIPTLLSCCGNDVCFTCAENWRSAQIAELPRNRKKIKCMLCNHLFHCRNDTPWIINRPFISVQGIDVDMSIVRGAQSAMQVSTAAITTAARSNIPQTRSQRSRHETENNNDGVDESISSDVKEIQQSGIHTSPLSPTLGNNSRRSPPPRRHETDINDDEDEDNDVVGTLPNTSADSDERHQLLSTASIIRRSHRLSSIRTGITMDVQSDDEDSDEELLGQLIYNSSRTAQLQREQQRQDKAEEERVPKKKHVHKSFEQRMDELRAYKEKHGHTTVKEKEDKSLNKFCQHMRHARNNPKKSTVTLTDDRIASLDALGFDWTVKEQHAKKSFQQRMDDLRAYKEKHRHTNVKKSEDTSLYQFCVDMRYARNNPEKSTALINDERIASLNALGFEWAVIERRDIKSFAQRLEDLRAYKEKNGHVNVKQSADKSLYEFFRKIRQARNNPGKSRRALTDDRIASLDALGFEWIVKDRVAKKSFAQRIEELQAYKEKHGHVNVKQSDDKNLYQFCCNTRVARNRPEKSNILINDERLASLEDLGFDWGSTNVVKSFAQRIADLQTYKEKHGHVNVKRSEDKSLHNFCNTIRYARNNPGKSNNMLIDEERISSLDALGFDWKMR